LTVIGDFSGVKKNDCLTVSGMLQQKVTSKVVSSRNALQAHGKDQRGTPLLLSKASACSTLLFGKVTMYIYEILVMKRHRERERERENLREGSTAEDALGELTWCDHPPQLVPQI
jgi:hypothetical protein